MCITSAARFADGKAPLEAFSISDVPDVKVIIALAEGQKCSRCWKVLPEVGTFATHIDLCKRCADVVDGLSAPD